MGITNRPGFDVDVDATRKSTEKKTVYYDLKPGEKTNFRFLPSSDAKTKKLFFESAQHFNFKQDGNSRTFACIDFHANANGEACPVCELLEACADPNSKISEKVRKKVLKDNLLRPRWHAQVIALKDEIEQLHVIGLSKTTADKVSEILAMERDNQQPKLTDPDEGQAIQISRNDKSGLQTRYGVLPTGIKAPLDKVYPQWAEEFLNVEEAVNLRIEDRETLIQAIQETYGNNVVSIVFPDFEG